jgi:hypothetical protein
MAATPTSTAHTIVKVPAIAETEFVQASKHATVTHHSACCCVTVCDAAAAGLESGNNISGQLTRMLFDNESAHGDDSEATSSVGLPLLEGPPTSSTLSSTNSAACDGMEPCRNHRQNRRSMLGTADQEMTLLQALPANAASLKEL